MAQTRSHIARPIFFPRLCRGLVVDRHIAQAGAAGQDLGGVFRDRGVISPGTVHPAARSAIVSAWNEVEGKRSSGQGHGVSEIVVAGGEPAAIRMKT